MENLKSKGAKVYFNKKPQITSTNSQPEIVV